MIKRLAVIGVGLIGGSLALALKKAGVVEHVVGCGRHQANLDTALKKGIIDSYTHDAGEAVENADMVFLAVPLGNMRSVLNAIKPHLNENVVITDGGSAKQSLIDDCIAVFGEVPEQFVAGHPIAGTEKNGADAAFAELYQQRRVILTPIATTNRQAQKKVTAMWEACGAVVTEMSIEHHDKVLAATSHLPHLLAFSLVDMLAKQEQQDEIFQYAAGGFRDFTRIASSNPTMWRDICLANNIAVTDMLDDYIQNLTTLRQVLSESDGQQLEEIFTDAKIARDTYVDAVEK